MLVRVLKSLIGSGAQKTQWSAKASADDQGAAFREGMELLGAGDADAAEIKFLDCIEADPDDGGARYGLGIVAFRRGAFDQAATWFEQALAQGFAIPETRFNLAESHAMAGRPDQACQHFVACIEASPDFVLAHLGLARALASRQRFEEAIPHFLRTGELFAARSDIQNAMATWEELLAIAPKQADACVALARSLLEAGEPLKALQRLRTAVSDTSDDARIYGLLGRAYTDLEQISPAVEAFRRAVDLEPEDPSMLVALGVALSDSGDHDSSLHCLRKAISMAPEMPEAHFNLGLELFESDEHDKALAHMEACRAANRGDPWAQVEYSSGAFEPIGSDQPVSAASHKLRHDLEQLEHLLDTNRLDSKFTSVVAAYRKLLAQLDAPETRNAAILLDAKTPSAVRATYNRPAFIPRCPALTGPAINPSLDSDAIESEYFRANPSVIYVDELLAPEALESLRRFALEGCFWHDVKSEYLGAYMYDGFCSGLLLQIADELRKSLPNILGGLRLQIFWAYKYDSNLKGIATHADKAAVNVNFWLTPDSANLDSDRGGLVVFQHKPPPDWSFREFNAEGNTIDEYLQSVGSESVTVPHRQNRAVIFDSALFHRTDEFRFRPGYENRRINVTMLYGVR